MGKTYSSATSGTTNITSARNITAAAPYDVRTVVDTYDDLFIKSTFGLSSMYIGMPVTTLDTQEIYILTKKPGLRDNEEKYRKNISWKKIGGSEFKPEDYVEFYSTKFGAKILSSSDELSTITSPYEGQFAVVKDIDGSTTLYTYIKSGNTGNWTKILSGGSSTGSTDSVITNDGTIPTSGTGLSVHKNDKDASIVETYADSKTELEANTYYTSRGLNSYDTNGGTLSGEDYIILSNNGDSYIKLYSKNHVSGNWIELCIKDDTLGITKSDISYVDTTNNEQPMVEDVLTLPREGLIKFGKKVVLTSLNESRSTGTSGLKFGSTGSTYEDIDIYTSNILPTVYAYANGIPVKVLTEADVPETISNDEIESLFTNI